jgi:ribosomal protein S18 acetylase RimI-like enzyme
MKLEFPSIVDYGLDRAAEVLTRAFADYLVSIVFDAGALLQSVRVDSVDLASSCIFVRNGTAVGGALIGRRGWTSRLAGMAILPEARRGGVGRTAVNHLLAEAKTRRDSRMVLEVIEQNTAAVHLYRAAGFREIRRLIGFAGPLLDVASAVPSGIEKDRSDLVEVDLREVGQAVTRYGLPDLPWQLSGETIAQLTPPNVAYRLNSEGVREQASAWIALTNPAAPTVTVRALIADKSLPTPGREATVLRAVMEKHPGRKEWRFSAIWPEELADIISAVGLPRSPLTQWQMERGM